MLENCYVLIDGQPMPTRLHEHGSQPAHEGQHCFYWPESGYLEGPNEGLLQKLKTQGNELSFYRDGGVVQVLQEIVWGETDCMYEHHWIIHLNWGRVDSCDCCHKRVLASSIQWVGDAVLEDALCPTCHQKFQEEWTAYLQNLKDGKND